jgi:single-strand DNA-binding protein
VEKNMLNNVSLMGRLTKDIEIKTIQNGSKVGRFTIAIDRNHVQAGKERETDFINLVAFGKTSEFIEKFFKKGKLICVVGSLQSSSWDGTDGKKHYSTDVIVDNVSFTGEKT